MRAHQPRRGIILLLILALLALFGMVAIAFVVLSSQTLKSTQALQRQEQTYYPPTNDVEEAAMQAIRGSSNPISKMGPQSLFEDIYGSNTVSGSFITYTADPPKSVVNVCGGQLIEFSPSVNLTNRIGSVLTITSPNTTAYGLSTRIVGFNPQNGRPQILAFPNGATLTVGTQFIVNGMPFSGTGAGANPISGKLDLRLTYSVLNNGYILSPYNPSGSPDLDANCSYPVALLPFLPLSIYNIGPTNPIDTTHDLPNGIPFPQLNEDYDAADYQNMLLATPLIGNRLLPSMHRPALVNYWYTQLFNSPVLQNISNDADRWNVILNPIANSGLITPPSSALPPRWSSAPTREQIVAYILEIKRLIIGRPLHEDHPNFNGSNATSIASSVILDGMNRPTNVWELGQFGNWDVDCDGDGVPDAIWLDIGLPVRSTPDGRKYKPLVAYYCLDMDGRLNLNAHGNLAQASVDYYNQGHLPTDPYFPEFTSPYFAQQSFPPTRRGRGFGPADINLFNPAILPIAHPNPLGPPNPPINIYRQLLNGIAGVNIEGRYGSDGVPGDCVDGMPKLFTGLSTVQPANVEQRKYNDYLSANKWFQFDGFRNSVPNPGTNPIVVDSIDRLAVFSEAPDPSGKGILGVDPAGRPVLQSITDLTTWKNSPYELNLNPQTLRGLISTSTANDPPDNPFSPSEFERILRPYDKDAQSLPTRLAALTSRNPAVPNNSFLLDGDNRQKITTESWDVPTYNAGLPSYMIQQVLNDLADPTNPLSRVPDWYKPVKITDILKGYIYCLLRRPPIGATYAALDPVNSSDPLRDASVQTENIFNNLTTPQLLSLFPPELLAGLKMDINHAFAGHAETLTNRNFNYAALWQNCGINNTYGQLWFGQIPDYRDGTNDALGVQFPSRQLYARYLYVLALLLRDRDMASGEAAVSQLFSPETPMDLTTAQKAELSNRRIAQWAINVACCKVNDSIMVPFEYPEKAMTIEFNSTTYSLIGWQCHDAIGTAWVNLDCVISPLDTATSSPKAPTDDLLPERRLVWGCKPPEVILTETLAFHNLHVADTSFEKVGGMKTTDPSTNDQDVDQPRIPQGSAFFELYCARDLHGSTLPPKDLYVQVGNNWYLDLGKLSPPDDNSHQYPVWRLVVSESGLKNPAANIIKQRVSDKPNSISLQTEQYRGGPTDHCSLLNTLSEPTVKIDRIVWLSSQAPVTSGSNPGVDEHYDSKRIYWNRSSMSALLDRGNYAVVGPRALTRVSLTPVPDANCILGSLGNQTITMPPAASPFVTPSNGTADPNIDNTRIKMPIGIIASGLPLVARLDDTGTTAAWVDTSNTAPDGVGVNISEPVFDEYYKEPTVDGPTGWSASLPYREKMKNWYGDPVGNGAVPFDNHPQDGIKGRPLYEDGMVKNDTVPTTLQPSSTYREYKTVFVQRLANPSKAFDPLSNPYRTVDWMPIDLTVYTGDDVNNIDTSPQKKLNFATRLRGGSTQSSDYNIWNPLISDSETDSPGSDSSYLNRDLVHSLGYLNKAFWCPVASDPLYPWITQANSPTLPAEYKGDPSVQPFPWLPWFGRPYVNELELMLVPSSDAARYLLEFKPCASTPNFYQTADGQQYPQLLNFFQEQSPVGGTQFDQFHRILNYIGVPSWYAGTDIQANPTLASNTTAPDGSHCFHTPYNKISTYREPGKINLNTIYHQEVFNGLMNGTTSPTWSDFWRSRQGYVGGGNILDKDPTGSIPTEFLAPFRSYDAPNLSPILVPSWLTSTLPPEINEIQATLLRKSNTNPNPLFQQSPTDYGVNPGDIIDRNPYFHYKDIMRLPNLTTTRSNVYALWVTVGYFEVTPVDVSNKPWITTPAQKQQIYPDGYELGQELGSDTGEIVRHRGFYMIDRSIPVGFQRGQDMNVDKAILLKRFIE